MSRPHIVALVLGLASPALAPAQMPPSPWTLASGDFTIFGHTDYSPTLVLIPRDEHELLRLRVEIDVVVLAQPRMPSTSLSQVAIAM